ncbi:MAG: hypothetical protein KIS91_14075 [Anaerolineae bacterium]|nr:hypothetical protein [Anaerolineae bacterium]
MVRVACVLLEPGTDVEQRPRLWAACLDALEGFSPAVETPGPGQAWVDVAALEALYGDGQALARLLAQAVANVAHARSSVAIADTPFAARLAAQHTSPGTETVWEPGTVAVRLAAMSLDVIPLDRETRQALGDRGVATLGDLAALPSATVTARFGLAARHAQRLILGEAVRPLTPRHTTMREGSRQLFPNPVWESFRLRSLVGLQARDLRVRLGERGLRPRRVRLTGELLNGEVRQSSRLLPMVGTGAAPVAAALDAMLAAWPVEDGITAVLMILETAAQTPVEERGVIVRWGRTVARGQ